mgnify:CR=1 FL=1
MRDLLTGGVIAAALGLAGCGSEGRSGEDTRPTQTVSTPATEPGGADPAPRPALPDWFDCLRREEALVIAAHRGGPAPGYPENALETLQRGAEAGLYLFEVDVAESADGVQFLMHDDTLSRTTTGSGRVADTQWAQIEDLRLVDRDGEVTEFTPPRLADLLDWAVAQNVVIELDAKRSASYETMVETVRAAGASDHVILISYTEGQARALNGHAPEMMLTADALNGADIEALAVAGIDRDRLIAWTGNESPAPQTWAALRAEGVEPAFGTLGRPGDRLDDAWRADGDLSEYAGLAEDGVVLLATDAPLDVAAALRADDRAFAACGR